jgi:hypothetical protein
MRLLGNSKTEDPLFATCRAGERYLDCRSRISARRSECRDPWLWVEVTLTVASADFRKEQSHDLPLLKHSYRR